jgi:hypothetical protein
MPVTLISKIPDWDIHGILPPIRPGEAPVSSDRSPYRTSADGLCLRFGQTAERRHILRGLIRLRAELQQAGVTNGFQWVDGSFAEDVEASQGRPPGDIDVVTFAPLGDAKRQQQLVAAHPDLFDPGRAKVHFLVDHYMVATDVTFDADQASWVAYWYSMWSHRRDDRRWKGFVQLSLAEDDSNATAWLSHHDKPAN